LEAEGGQVQILNESFAADCHVAITTFFNLSLFQQADFKNRKIAFVFAEYTKYPPKLLSALSSVDEIWTTSHWHQKIFRQLFAGPIHVVPEGVDPILFNPTVEPNKTIRGVDGFKFICVARPYTRKNLPILVKAFLKEFEGTDVKLLLAMGLNEILPQFKHQQIVNIQPVTSHGTMAKIYRGCQAFVLPTRGEGWGLPICEAMACGLPVITTLYSGVTEYAKPELIYPINFNLIDVESTNNPENGIIKEQGSGEWADPDCDHLRHQMRYVYENYEEAKAKGIEASKHILENFTWEHTGKKLEAIL
jgi:glycosyltransferase involved in cell wall biosynthesis